MSWYWLVQLGVLAGVLDGYWLASPRAMPPPEFPLIANTRPPTLIEPVKPNWTEDADG